MTLLPGGTLGKLLWVHNYIPSRMQWHQKLPNTGFGTHNLTTIAHFLAP